MYCLGCFGIELFSFGLTLLEDDVVFHVLDDLDI